MKCVLRAVTIAILVSATAQAGLVTDEGVGIGRSPKSDDVAQPVSAREVAPPTAVVEEKDSPTVDIDTPEPAQTSNNQAHRGGERAFFVAVGVSDGGSNVRTGTVGMDFFYAEAWTESENWILTSYLELLAAYWKGDAGHTGITDIHEGAASGYLRCIHQKRAGGAVRPYVDLGAGLHYVDEDRIESKELGEQWLVGSNAGIGLVLGEDEGLDIGIRIRHLSNGGTDETNWGINHYMVRAAIRF